MRGWRGTRLKDNTYINTYINTTVIGSHRQIPKLQLASEMSHSGQSETARTGDGRALSHDPEAKKISNFKGGEFLIGLAGEEYRGLERNCSESHRIRIHRELLSLGVDGGLTSQSSKRFRIIDILARSLIRLNPKP